MEWVSWLIASRGNGSSGHIVMGASVAAITVQKISKNGDGREAFFNLLSRKLKLQKKEERKACVVLGFQKNKIAKKKKKGEEGVDENALQKIRKKGRDASSTENGVENKKKKCEHAKQIEFLYIVINEYLDVVKFNQLAAQPPS